MCVSSGPCKFCCVCVRTHTVGRVAWHPLSQCAFRSEVWEVHALPSRISPTQSSLCMHLQKDTCISSGRLILESV